MPAEWDLYLQRMGRACEVGAGGGGDIPLESLVWNEVDEATGGEARGGDRPKRECDRETERSGGIASPRGCFAHDASIGGADAAGTTRPMDIETAAVVTPPAAAAAPRPPEHVARAFPERARQFMPFAALKGFEELIAEEERRAAENQASAEKYSQPDRFSPA